MNPYQPPSNPPPKPAEITPDHALADVVAGLRCEKCGSTNTAAERALRSKPSILGFVLFGWVFLLIQSAFSKQREVCHDCGAVRLYKTTGSKLSMVLLLVVVLVLVINFFGNLQSR